MSESQTNAVEVDENFRILNSEVARELSEDLELFLAFGPSRIDPEIQPLHNPDWRASRMLEEAARLNGAKILLAEMRACHLLLKDRASKK